MELKNDAVRGFILVGCGTIAQKHVIQIQSLGRLVAILDTDPEKANRFALQHQVPAFYTFDDLIQAGLSADIMVICTPNGFHAAQTLKALNHGYHVLCEKPMALTSADGKNMLETARQAKRLLMIVKQNRFNPPVQRLKQWIGSGASGQLYSYSLNCLWNRNPEYYTSSSWRGTLDLDGGTLYTQFSHYIDFLYWLFGQPSEIHGYRANRAHQDIIHFEDQGVVSLAYDSGLTGGIHYSINCFEKNMESSLTVLAQNGSIRIGGPSCNIIEYQCIKNDYWQPGDEPSDTNRYGGYTGSMSNHNQVYKQFLKALNQDEFNDQGAYEAMKTVELIEEIYRHSSFVNRHS